MLQIILSCIVAAGTSFTVPNGWTVESVKAGGGNSWITLTDICTGKCAEDRRIAHESTYITLRGQAKPGEVINPPTGCNLRIEK